MTNRFLHVLVYVQLCHMRRESSRTIQPYQYYRNSTWKWIKSNSLPALFCPSLEVKRQNEITSLLCLTDSSDACSLRCERCFKRALITVRTHAYGWGSVMDGRQIKALRLTCMQQPGYNARLPANLHRKLFLQWSAERPHELHTCFHTVQTIILTSCCDRHPGLPVAKRPSSEGSWPDTDTQCKTWHSNHENVLPLIARLISVREAGRSGEGELFF